MIYYSNVNKVVIEKYVDSIIYLDISDNYAHKHA